MIWTPEIVRSRFVEACDTERRLPIGGGCSSGGFWPAYVHSFEDMNGWGTKRVAEERELRMSRIPPTASAISRFEEVMSWSGATIHDDARRRIIWCVRDAVVVKLDDQRLNDFERQFLKNIGGKLYGESVGAI